MGVSQWVMVAKSGMIGFYQIMADLANWRGDSTPPLAAYGCEIPAFAGMVWRGTGVCVDFGVCSPPDHFAGLKPIAVIDSCRSCVAVGVGVCR